MIKTRRQVSSLLRRHCGYLKLVIGGTLMAMLASTVAAAPVLFHAADPAGPGETLMLFGDGLDGAAVRAVRLPDGDPGTPRAARELPATETPLAPLQANARCIKVLLPGGWQPGCYAVRAGAAPPLVVNRAEAWWLLGGCPLGPGAAASPGAEVRVFGKNFAVGGAGAKWPGRVAVRDAAGQTHPLEVLSANPYAVTARLPERLPEGEATLWVHNGHGGPFGWSAPLALTVRRAASWPTTSYNVRDLGARGDSRADDTGAIRAALQKCQENGGGVVFLPRGAYKITGPLTMPPHTVLRGEKREVVWLFVPVQTPEFNSVIAGNSEFGVEDLSLVAQTPRRLITAPDVEPMYRMPWGDPGTPPAKASDIFLRRLRLQHLRYAHRVTTADKDPRRLESTGPSTVALSGERLEVSDCEIVSSGMPILIHGTKHTRIQRNHLHTGRSGWYGMWGATETVFEGNTIEGRDLEASYGGFANYGSAGGTDVSRLYIAENRFLNGFGCEREALTFDTPGRYPWAGHVTGAGASSLAAAGAGWKENDFRGLACLIVSGKGLGQHRRIAGNTADRLTLDQLWEIVPDATSVTAIRPFRRDVVIYRNHMQDTSVGVQLWAGGYNFLIDGNTAVRTGGLWGTAGQYESRGQQVFLPCYFTQWLNNEIREGFIYQQGGEADNSAVLGLYSRDVPAGPDAGVRVLGNVIRGNRVSDNTRIGLLYYGDAQLAKARSAYGSKTPPVAAGRDNVIEGNTVSDGRVGIEVAPGFEGTVIRNNHFEQVGEKVRD